MVIAEREENVNEEKQEKSDCLWGPWRNSNFVKFPLSLPCYSPSFFGFCLSLTHTHTHTHTHNKTPKFLPPPPFCTNLENRNKQIKRKQRSVIQDHRVCFRAHVSESWFPSLPYSVPFLSSFIFKQKWEQNIGLGGGKSEEDTNPTALQLVFYLVFMFTCWEQSHT